MKASLVETRIPQELSVEPVYFLATTSLEKSSSGRPRAFLEIASDPSDGNLITYSIPASTSAGLYGCAFQPGAGWSTKSFWPSPSKQTTGPRVPEATDSKRFEFGKLAHVLKRFLLDIPDRR